MTKKQLTIFIIAILITGGLIFKFILGPGAFSTKQEVSRATGNQNAPIKIVEFIDFQCPACAVGSKFLNDRVKKDPEKYYLELKYFPLRNHTHGLLASHFAECSGEQGKFWEFHDEVLAMQGQWARLVNARPAFEFIAKKIELNQDQLNVCLQNPKTEETIMADKAEGQALKIRSTPTYFVNGKMVVGIKSLKDELQKIDPQE